MRFPVIGRWLIVFSILAGNLRPSHGADADRPGETAADATTLGLPLVFDPASRKYFLAGTAKFSLRPAQESTVIDSIEISIDGGDFGPYGGEIKFKDEGKHTLKFRARNPVNTWSPVQFTEVFVDMTPPVTEAKWTEKAAFTERDAVFLGMGSLLTLVAQDNLSGVGRIEYSWDGERYLPFVRPIPVEKTGRQVLRYRSVDKVSNVEPTKEFEFTADGAPPVSIMKVEGAAKPITYAGKSYLGASDASGFDLTAVDDLSGVKQILISIDGEPFTPYIKTLYFLRDGAHVLRYQAQDRVGNKEEVKSVTVYTVSRAPRTAAIGIGKLVNTGGVNFAPRDFQLKLEAKETVVGLDRIEIKLDEDGDFRPYVEPIRFTKAGLQTVSYRAVDRVGNVEPTRLFTIHVHMDPPVTDLVTSAPLVVREGISYSPSPNVLSLQVTNSTVGVETTLVGLEDAKLVPYKGPITFTADRKVHKISYRSIDKLGNEEATRSVNLHMISNAPVVDLFVSGENAAEEKVRTGLFDQTPRYIDAEGTDAPVVKPAPKAIVKPTGKRADRKPAAKKKPGKKSKK